MGTWSVKNPYDTTEYIQDRMKESWNCFNKIRTCNSSNGKHHRHQDMDPYSEAAKKRSVLEQDIEVINEIGCDQVSSISSQNWNTFSPAFWQNKKIRIQQISHKHSFSYSQELG